MRLYTFAFIVASTMSASAALAQGSEDRPRGDTSSMPSLSFEDYARSRGFAPFKQFRRTPDLDGARRQLKASVDSASMRLLAMRAPSRVACPMPVAKQDSGSVPPMPAFATGASQTPYGTLAGCENPLGPTR